MRKMLFVNKIRKSLTSKKTSILKSKVLFKNNLISALKDCKSKRWSKTDNYLKK